VEAKLTPESQQILGTAPEAPQTKTRLQQKPVVPKKQKQAAIVAEKNRNKPAPPGAEEVADQAVNSAPLGLNGDTASKQKAAKAAGEKQRIQGKTETAKTAAKPNPGTPGSGTSSSGTASSDSATTTETSAPAKKRHKLLGIL
jgi:peptidyl-prolyl cis-trans isomerase SurA